MDALKLLNNFNIDKNYRRQDKFTTFFNIAKEIAKQSHDAQTQHGCILVKEGRIIGTGFNGFVSGSPDNKLSNLRPDKYNHIIHAELNAIINCAKEGISVNGAIMFCTGLPCLECTKLLIQSGIKKWFIGDVGHKESPEIKKIREFYILFHKIEIFTGNYKRDITREIKDANKDIIYEGDE